MKNRSFRALSTSCQLAAILVASTSCGDGASSPGTPSNSAGTAGVAPSNGTGGTGNLAGAATIGGGSPGGLGGSGVGTSGSSTGGVAPVGGANPGGGTAPTGGADPGGGGAPPIGGAGGPSAGSAGTGAVSSSAPAGYTSWGPWHGCSWTGEGEFAADTTTVTPQDFVSKPPADPFCISGTVGAEPEYRSVALLGFNVNEAPPPDCAYEAADPNAEGPPAIKPTGNGVAVNFVKRGTDTSFILRIQIQGPNGHKPGDVGAADRWCYELTTNGKVFVPYEAFTPECWEPVAADRGTPYNKQDISAVVFTVPGSPTATPFDFCVNGFVEGSSAADAPDGPAVAGEQKGVVGGAGSNDLDFARAKVTVGGKDYIIQNNNWGNPSGTDLILNYTNNSFKLASGSGSGGDAPASFPSIFIGGNGNTRNGQYSTHPGDGLPARISEIQSIPSTFRYSGTTDVFNATYDIWFAKSPPPATSEYRDGIDGFVMIWLRDPTGKQPIGQNRGTVMVAGQTWNVWSGPRGQGPNTGSGSGLPVIQSDPNAPVVSFVNPNENDDSRSQSFVNKNLKEFFTAATQVTQNPLSGDLYLTDVFAGFEIWQGGAGKNLGVDEFTISVNK